MNEPKTTQIAETINALAVMLKRAEVPGNKDAETLRHAIYLLKDLLVKSRGRR